MALKVWWDFSDRSTVFAGGGPNGGDHQELLRPAQHGDRIHIARDKSGNSFTCYVVESNGVSMPVAGSAMYDVTGFGGRPAARFLGTSQCIMGTIGTVLNDTSSTIFVVFKNWHPSGGTSTILGLGGQVTQEQAYVHDGVTGYAMYQFPSLADGVNFMQIGGDGRLPNILTIRNNGTKIDAWVNGHIGVASCINGSTFWMAQNVYNIGGAGGNYSTNLVGEYRFYDTTMTIAEMDAVGRELQQKWSTTPWAG